MQYTCKGFFCVLFPPYISMYLCGKNKDMSLRIDKTTLQFDIKTNYDAQQLNKFKEDLTAANNKLAELTNERKELHKPKKSDKAAWDEYHQKLRDVNKRIIEQQAVVKKATEVVEQQRKKMGLTGLTLQELQQELRKYNTIMANIQPGTEGFNETKQHIRDIKDRIKELKDGVAFEVKDTKNSLLKFAENWNHIGFAIGNAFNIKNQIASVVNSIRSTLDPMAEMAREAEGVEMAFERMDRPDMLDQLRQATHGTVTDLELMKQAVKFNDFNLPVEQLGTYLAFAQQKAKDTGESIDELVTSIVNGLGRQSPQILDNLGLSAKQISEEAKRSGDFFGAVAKIVKENMAEAGEYVETSAERAAQANVRLKNAQEDLGKAWLPIMEQLDETYVEVQLRIIEVVKWTLQHRDTIINLVSAIGILTAMYNAQLIKTIALDKAEKALDIVMKGRIAIVGLLKSAMVALRIVYASCTTTTIAFRRALIASQAAATVNPWVALATVLTGIGIAVYGVIKALGKADVSLTQAARAQRELAAAEREGEKTAATETAKVRQLYQATQDTTRSMDERLSAVKRLKSEYPSYFAQLSNEAILTGQASEQYQQLTKDILAAAKARAYQSRIDKLAEADVDIENQLTKEDKWLKDNKERFEQAVVTANTYSTKWGKDLSKQRSKAARFVNEYKSRRDSAAVLRQQHLSNVTQQDQYAERVLEYQPSVDRLSSNNHTNNPTPPTPNKTTGGTSDQDKELEKARQELKKQEELAKQLRAQADLQAKEQYQKRLITEEQYHEQSFANETAYIARLQEIRESQYSTEAEKQEAQNMALDAMINEANYQREQKQKDLQQTLTMMEQSYQTDQIALEQQRMSGEFATEEEYNRKKIEAEIDYQRQRLQVIREAGGDTLEAEMALQRALMQQTKEAQAQRLTELKKQSDIADLQHDYDQQLAIQQQMLDEKLISQEQYEQNVTDIVTAAEQDRQSIRESYAQAAQQLMSATSSLFSAMQSREEARVDKKYKTLIDRAKKNGKDTTKLEEQQEQEKLDIKKKYADKQFYLTVLQIISQAALGIQKIWAEWGWNPPVAAGLTATESAVAAIQLATAKAQRDQAAGLYAGGYSDEVEGYTGEGNPRDVAGVIPVHKKEFVINHEALKIPVIRKVADVIDSAQKRKSYNIENTTRILQDTIITHQGFANGGYTITSPVQSVVASPQPSDPRILEAITENTKLLEKLLSEGITILRLRKGIKHQESLESNARR